MSGRPAGERQESGGRGFYLLVTVVALFLAVYFAFQVIGLLFRLVFLTLAVAVAYYAYQAWRDRR